MRQSARALLTALALAIPGSGSAQSTSAAPTFASDVAPIVFRHCLACHHDGGAGPFPLSTYAEVRQHASQIAEVTASGAMPPWKPVDGGPFVGERRLSAADRDVIRRWVESGSPPGRPEDLPPRPAIQSGWLHGEPDLVVRLQPYTLRADGPDVFRNFVVRLPGTSVRHVRGLQLIPGTRAIHHANIRVDATDTSRRLDAADPDGGYEGFVPRTADYPSGHFLGWTPGQAPPLAPAELAWDLQPGSDFVVQLHLYPTGKPETIAPTIGLYLSETPPTRVPSIVRLGRQTIRIPGGERSFVAEDEFVLPVDVQVLAIQPHAHYRARDVRVAATVPGGARRTLLAISDWDFAWQDQYRFAAPFWLPAGTRITMTFRFDNTTSNPRNPDHPPRTVEWGWRSTDEMADVWIQVQTRSDDDRRVFASDASRKMASEDAKGTEVLIRRQPDYVALRNDAALIYMSLGQADDALRHFAVVTRLEPASAAAWLNEGTALEHLGRPKEAEERYRRALALAPSYSSAHNNLGNLLLAGGHTVEALAAFRKAVESDPRNADARSNLGALLMTSDLTQAIEHLAAAVSVAPTHANAHFNLGRALTLGGRAADAVREYRAALTERPDWAPALVNLAWLLSAHADVAIRNPTEAVSLASSAVTITEREDAAALDVLACALASVGRFGEAEQTATRAADLSEKNGRRELASAIRARAALYRAGRPFVID